jgi:DNA primase
MGAAGRASRATRPVAVASGQAVEQPPAKETHPLPDPHDRMLASERETAKLLIQVPQLFGPGWDGLSVTDFTHPAYAAVFTSVEKAAVAEDGGDWIHRVGQAAEHEQVRSLIVSLAVEALPVHGEVTSRFVIAHAVGLQLLTVMRQIAQLKSKLQRTNPVESPTKYNQMFSELVVLEARRKAMQTRSLGAQD